MQIYKQRVCSEVISIIRAVTGSLAACPWAPPGGSANNSNRLPIKLLCVLILQLNMLVDCCFEQQMKVSTGVCKV